MNFLGFEAGLFIPVDKLMLTTKRIHQNKKSMYLLVYWNYPSCVARFHETGIKDFVLRTSMIPGNFIVNDVVGMLVISAIGECDVSDCFAIYKVVALISFKGNAITFSVSNV